jgi:hypothetical protein
LGGEGGLEHGRPPSRKFTVVKDGTVPDAGSSEPSIRAASQPHLGDNAQVDRFLTATVASCLLAVACGGRPAELVPPVGEPSLVDPTAEFPKIRFADGLVSVNDRCPVTKRKLSPLFPPVYVNGLPIGFC